MLCSTPARCGNARSIMLCTPGARWWPEPGIGSGFLGKTTSSWHVTTLPSSRSSIVQLSAPVFLCTRPKTKTGSCSYLARLGSASRTSIRPVGSCSSACGIIAAPAAVGDPYTVERILRAGFGIHTCEIPDRLL